MLPPNNRNKGSYNTLETMIPFHQPDPFISISFMHFKESENRGSLKRLLEYNIDPLYAFDQP